MKPYNKEESKRIQIRRMFNNIAPYYDRICHILSFNIDRLWRKRLVELVAERSIKPNIRLLCEDAENLSLSSNTFDVVTISFGIRNFENIVKGLSECHRILKEGGSLFIMEFSTPKHKVFNVLYRIYSKHILPLIGQVISNDDKAYKYLPESIVEFNREHEFTELLLNNGFDSCISISLSNGIAHIYIGVKSKM